MEQRWEESVSTFEREPGQPFCNEINIGFRYVATEEGILEYTVNIDERKTFPRIDLR